MSSPDDHFPDDHRSDDRSSDNRRTAVAVGTGVTGSLQSLLGTVVVAVFVITFVVQAFQIPSPSMENTLLVGD
jgi:signal peptidase I